MNNMRTSSRELWVAVRITLLFALVTGIVYPLAMTGAAQAVFHDQANGSLITHNGQVVGSRLIGQNFTDPKYFWGRPSDIVTTGPNGSPSPDPNDAANSMGSNYGPSNACLLDSTSNGCNPAIPGIKQRVAAVRAANPSFTGEVPIDMVTSDFSGFDPDISEASALLQVDRVAAARHLDAARVRQLVEDHVDARSLGLFGEPHVNVLELNLDLDAGGAG